MDQIGRPAPRSRISRQHAINRSTFSRLLVALIVSVAANPVAVVALDPDRSIHQYRHTKWTRDDGAPAPIHAIAQGRDGYLWLASGDGLFRFDGLAFERIDRDIRDETGGPRTLLVAANGDIWTSYSASGKLAVYRHGQLRFIPAPPFEGEIIDLIQTPDGDVWAAIGQIGRPMLRYRKGAWTEIQPTDGFGRDSFHSFAVTRDGALWISYTDKILRKRAGADRFELASSQADTRPHLALDREGRLWARDAMGVRPLTGVGGQWTGRPAPFSHPTNKVRRGFVTTFDRDGNFWVARRADGIERLRVPSPLGPKHAVASSSEYLAKDGLTSDSANAIFEDREGNIWVATSLGLDRFRNANIAVEPELTRPAAYGDILHTARDGSVYIAQADAVFRANPGRSPEALLAGTGEPEAMCDGPGEAVWVVLADRILVIAGEVQTSLARPPNTETGIYECGLDRWGRMWMTGAASGLFRRTDRGWFHMPGQPEEQVFYPTQMVRDAISGDSWLIWGVNRFARLDYEGQTFVPADQPRSLGEVHTMAPTRAGILLAGSEGIGRMTDGKIAFLPIDRAQPLRGANGIVQTNKGETWALGHRGFYRMRTQDLDRVFADPAFKLSGRLFDFVDGLPDRYSRQSFRSLVQGGDGRLWGTTLAGTVWIDPSHITQNKTPPPVAIGTLFAAGKRYLDPKHISLPSGSSSLAIGFAALNLGMPERAELRYKLEGQDETWVDPGSRRQATYTNLGPGKYRFRVIAANEDGVWNRTGATLEVTIPPTFLQSVWFKLLFALALLLVGAGFYALRVRQLEARLQNRFDIRIAERERIARELHDTLLQGFQALMLQFKAGVNRLPEPQQKPLNEALTRAQSVLVEGRDRVRDLRTPHSDVDLGSALHALASDVARDSGLEIRLISEGAPHDIHSLVHEEIERITEEAVRNAINHAQASTLEILVVWEARRLLVAIRDNGVGIPDDVASQGAREGHFGMIGMRERAGRIGGELVVSSRPGRGTEVALSLPGRVAYRDRRAGWIDRLFSLLPLRGSVS